MTDEMPSLIIGKILGAGGVIIAFLAIFMGIGAVGSPHAFGNTVAPWICIGGIGVAALGLTITVSYRAGYERAKKDGAKL